LDSGTVVPHRTPAATSAGKTRRLRAVIRPANPQVTEYLAHRSLYQL
jgi:hypothetical protein